MEPGKKLSMKERLALKKKKQVEVKSFDPNSQKQKQDEEETPVNDNGYSEFFKEQCTTYEEYLAKLDDINQQLKQYENVDRKSLKPQ